MRKNYEELAFRFEQSGLSRKEFGIQEGMSSNMVGYYLKKAQRTKGGSSGLFKELQISPCDVSSKHIRITTSTGVSIEIPL